VHAAALSGGAALAVGRAAEDERELDADERTRAKAAARACRGNGVALGVAGELLESALAGESIVLAKACLKRALDAATRARDNHLRALVLALAGAHYVHTSGPQAAAMLRGARQLAAALGAPVVKGEGAQDAVGNAVLGLSVGERYLGELNLWDTVISLTISPELYRRAGDDENARKQASANARLARAVDRLQERGRTLDAIATTD
jgi:hypothetical protein